MTLTEIGCNAPGCTRHDGGGGTVSEQYQIDYTISRVADDGRVTEIGFGGTGRWDTIREAAYEVESQLANDEWSHTSPEAAKGGGE